MIVSLASQAFGQWAEDRPSRYSFTIGGFAPTCSKLADDTGSVWKSLAGSYALRLDSEERPCASIELGLAESSADHFKGTLYSAVFMKTWHANTKGTKGIYYGLGAGLFDGRERRESYWGSPVTYFSGFTKSGARPGLCANAGVNLSDTWFAEARYTGVSSIGSGLDFSGLSISGGARFTF